MTFDATLLWQKIAELEAEIKKLKNPKKMAEEEISKLQVRNK